jgi:predicted dinucleotide-binding enzyme
MQIGIIGAGHIGGTLAALFVRAGHDVVLSNSRGPESLKALVAELGDHVTAGTSEEAARAGEVVVVSIPFGRFRDLPADDLEAKIVVDTGNYYPQRDGHFEELDDDRTTSSELLQAHLHARVVKAFNAMNWVALRDESKPAGDPERLGIPISADDMEAKHVVSQLIDDIGFDPVDAGMLGEGGRRHQPGAAVFAVALPTRDLRKLLAG